MPRGPKGEKRPAGVIGNAVKVMGSRPGRKPRKCRRQSGLRPASAVAQHVQRPFHRNNDPNCTSRRTGKMEKI